MKKGAAIATAFALTCSALLVVSRALLSDDSGVGATSASASDPPRSRVAEATEGLEGTRSGLTEHEPTADDGGFANRDLLVKSSPPRDGPTLIFVECETGHPRPDAAVWLVQRDEVSEEEWDALGRFDADTGSLLVERGHPLELDALATATLAWSESAAMVFATAGERHLRRSLELDHSDRLVLRLVRREKLTLVTVDPEGRRQREVPVVLQSLLRGDPWKPPPRVVFAQTTDRSAEAVVAQGSDLLDQHLDADGLATVRVVVAALAFPCRDPHPTLIDPRLGCTRPVELVTPPRSTLKLRAVDLKGSPLTTDVVVRAAAVEVVPPTLPSQHEWTTTIGAGGSTELTVEADLPIRLDAWTRDGGFGIARRTVVAPVRGTTDEVVLVLHPNAVPSRPGWLSYAVRVAAPDGSLLRQARLHWQIDCPSFPCPFGTRLKAGHTDADAVLHVEFEPDPAPESSVDRRAPVARALDVFDGIETLISRGARRHGAIALPEPADSWPIDPPTVVLSEVPLLLAGRVLDREGGGVPEVDIYVRKRSDPPYVLASWTTRSGINGAFSIRAATEERWLEVWPSREGWYRIDEYDSFGWKRLISVALGQDDLEITMHRKGFVRGRLLVDPGISLTDLSLEVLPEPAPDVRTRLHPDGRFIVEGAPAWRTLMVRSRLGGAEPIVRVDGVRFEEAKETVDPRLDPIDLRGALRQMELWVKSARDDSPIAYASLFLTRNRGTQDAPRTTDPFGRALVTTPTFDSALAVGTPAHLFQLLCFDRSFAEVKLEPAVVVRVTVEGPVEPLLASPRFAPWLRLEQASGGELLQSLWREFPPPSAHRVDDRTFEFRATVTGSYALRWKRQVGDDKWQTVRSPASVVVPPGHDTVEVVEKFSDDEAKAIGAWIAR